MRLEDFRNAGLVAVIAVTAIGCGRQDTDAIATRTPEVAAASAGPRASTVPDATVFTGPRTSTAPSVLRPPEIVQDPLKKKTVDYARALLDGRLDDLMNMTAIPYRTSSYRQMIQGYITRYYLVCRDKKIIDVSILENQGITIGVALFDSTCKIPFGSLFINRDHVKVLFQKVDGEQQPGGIDIN